MSTKKPRTKLTYLHKKSHTEIKGDDKLVVEEVVMDGPRGVSFKFFHKKNDKTKKVTGRQDEAGKFSLRVMEDKEVKLDEKDLSLADLLKHLKKMKDLDFAVKYLSAAKKQKGGYYHYVGSPMAGGRKGSKRRASKKRSKKVSKKASKKRSKKSSKKVSKKRPKKKVSKKRSKKSRK